MILFHHFTWQQFGIAAIILTLIWYGLLGVVYYRKLPGGLGLARGKTSGEPLPHHWPTEEEDGGSDELMGNASEPEGVSTVSFDSFGFVDNTSRERRPESGETTETDDILLGPIPDVLEEVKSIVHTVETAEGGKADFISLFKMVAAKYTRIRDTHHLEAINRWISENVPYHLTEDELNRLWD